MEKSNVDGARWEPLGGAGARCAGDAGLNEKFIGVGKACDRLGGVGRGVAEGGCTGCDGGSAGRGTTMASGGGGGGSGNSAVVVGGGGAGGGGVGDGVGWACVCICGDGGCGKGGGDGGTRAVWGVGGAGGGVAAA